MSTIMETVMMLFLVCALLCAFVAMGYALWSTLPQQGQERLAVALRRLTGRRVSVRSAPPIYAVQVDGQLLYASGKRTWKIFCVPPVWWPGGRYCGSSAPSGRPRCSSRAARRAS